MRGIKVPSSFPKFSRSGNPRENDGTDPVTEDWSKDLNQGVLPSMNIKSLIAIVCAFAMMVPSAALAPPDNLMKSRREIDMLAA